jgi:hypothetical protein
MALAREVSSFTPLPEGYPKEVILLELQASRTIVLAKDERGIIAR